MGRKKELDFLKRELIDKGQAVFVWGYYGMGKTALAHFFAETHKEFFPGGIHYTYAYGKDSVESYVIENIQFPIETRVLLVIDEADNLHSKDLIYLRQLHKQNKSLSMLILGVRRDELQSTDISNLELSGLSKTEFMELIRDRLESFRPDVAERFYDFVNGHPAVAEVAISSIRNGLFSLSQLFDAFEDFHASGILGPDGKPFKSDISPPPKLIVDIRGVNDELIDMLKANPELLRKLPSRKFEEIVAELLNRQGYKVEMTPTTRDGGFDIYAARSDALGNFLFLVECKKYTPPSKVGVQVVRSIYGTVQQTKATAGIIATTSFFTSAAVEFQREVKYQLQLRDFFEVKKWLGLI